MKYSVSSLFAAAAMVAVMHGDAQAASDARLAGLWKLVSYDVEVQSSGKMIPVMGQHPTGYAYFTPGGRVFFDLTGEGRRAVPHTDAAGCAALLDTTVAYSGKYTTSGDQWTAKLDVAWDPKWVGTEQTRHFSLDGERLRVTTPWREMPNWAKEGMTRSIVTFERTADD